MESKGQRRGGSTKRNKRSSDRRSSQAQLTVRPRRGIRLLPSEEFVFSADQRRILALHINRGTLAAKPFLDEVEARVREYLTAKLQRRGASSPAAIRRALLQARHHAEDLLRVFDRIGMLAEDYSANGYAVETLLYLEARKLSRRAITFPGDLLEMLLLLIQTIDSGVFGGLKPLEQEMRRRGLNAAGPEVPRQYFLGLTAKYRRRVLPLTGRPKKTDETKLIARMAEAYHKQFGKLPPKSRWCMFHAFVQTVFCFSGSGVVLSKPDCSRLVRRGVDLATISRSRPHRGPRTRPAASK